MSVFSVLYRLNGGEVLKIAPEKSPGVFQLFPDRDAAIYGVATNATIAGEAALKTAKDASQAAYAAKVSEVNTRLSNLGVLVATPVEEAAEMLLRTEEQNARIAYLQTPTVETKNTWVAKHTEWKAYQAQIQQRISDDRASLMTAQEVSDLAALKAQSDADVEAWHQAQHCCDVTTDPVGPRRVLNFAKVYESGPNEVRLATQPEIDGWAALEVDDENTKDAEHTTRLLKQHPQFRKFAQLMFKAMNQIRSDAGLTPWTKPQIVNFIDNNVSKDD